MVLIQIFIIRLFDALLMTIETIQIIKGNRKIGSILSFIEVLIWFLIIKEALRENNSFLVALVYALGYCIGTYLGSFLSNKYSKEKIMVQVISSNKNIKEILKNNDITFSLINSSGSYSNNYIFLIIINNNLFIKIKNLVLKEDSNAFISTYESKKIINGYFH